ncbi:5-hydroxytryptamine receptor 3A-like [Toxotes jaculatrix]|uniref:5-hydroxytryptamine receptor 3A-like n=1 Tax=Toxotes jaculatrix TaxID=941984 RepID=UPI001B3AEAC6|nr:5-hydroxytryptamine receptor 3A-like [Toxotes jaculatrix]
MSPTGVAVMMLAGFLFLLFLSDGMCSEDSCSYQDVLNYLNLTKTNEQYFVTRPVKNYKNHTLVQLEVLIYAILDVVEKEQKFIPYVWTVMRWKNEYISWDPEQFCGIDNVSLPAEMLWKPDLTIEEMTERDKAPPSPYITINNEGDVEIHNDLVLVSTCRMHTYKFPFDTQSCNLSFKSVIHTVRDLRLRPSDVSSEATECSKDVMRTQYEWLFINMNVTTNKGNFSHEQDIIIYTINMKRRSAFYIVNFLLPVLFFLCLDLASFMISNRGGEKLSFKVTVLLAVTVMQLILNDILPSSSDKIPLIAVYCIGIFALMMLSLLETIVVMYLMEKDLHQSNKADKDPHLTEGCRTQGETDFRICHRELDNQMQSLHVYDDESPSELLSVTKEHNTSKMVDENRALEKVSDELRQMEKTLTLLLYSKNNRFTHGSWTRIAKRFNRVFVAFYVALNCGFLTFLFLKWSSDEN